MNGHPLRDARLLFCMPHHGRDGTGGNGPAGNRSREEPRYGLVLPQIENERVEGRRRENAVPV